MDKDRTEICRIVSDMLDNPDEHGIYPTGKAYNALEALVHGARCEGIGWAHADACASLDAGEDPRKTDCAEQLKRAEHDLV
jgi:hypothetical protein